MLHRAASPPRPPPSAPPPPPLYCVAPRRLNTICECVAASTPTIANGMAGVTAAWEAMRKTFRPDIDLHDLKDYKDLEEPITGAVTFPPSE